MAKIKYQQIRTAKGIAVYPSIHKEATFKDPDSGKTTPTGKFECKIILDDKDAKKMVAQLEKVWQEAVNNPAQYGLRASIMSKVGEGEDPNLGFYENKDGDIVFKTSCKTKWTNREGKECPITVTVFDAKAKPTNVEVTGGSTIKLQITLVPYAMTKSNYGISLRLEAVQLLELKEWTSNPFDAEDGYEGMKDQEEKEEKDEDNCWGEEEEAPEEDDDF